MRSDEECEFEDEDESITIKCFKAGQTGATVFGLHNKDSSTGAGEKIKNYLNKQQVENVVFVLGDVDFFIHLLKHIDGTDPSSFIKNIMNVYSSYIETNVRKNVKNKVIVFDIIPYSFDYYRHQVSLDLKHGSLFFILKEFREAMKKMTEEYGYSFLSVTNEVTNSSGILNPEYCNKKDAKDIHGDEKMIQPVVLRKLKEII